MSKALSSCDSREINPCATPRHVVLPCPFCGSFNIDDDAIWNDRTDQNPKARKFLIMCGTCRACGPLCGPSMRDGCGHKGSGLSRGCCHVDSWTCFHGLAWEAWNIRGGPFWILSDRARDGLQKLKPRKLTDGFGKKVRGHQPCPFCRSLDLKIEDWGGGNVVTCANCVCRGPEGPEGGRGYSVEKAWKKWDFRRNF